MFDKVLKPNVTQDQVYTSAAKNIVKGKAEFLSEKWQPWMHHHHAAAAGSTLFHEIFSPCYLQ